MQHQNPYNRSAAYAALDFAVPSPLSSCLSGGFHLSFNSRLTAQSSPAEGSLPQVCFTGLQLGAADLWMADTGLSPFTTNSQFGVALPGCSLARQALRRNYSSNPAGSISRFGQAHSHRFAHLPTPEAARQVLPLAVDRRLSFARFNRNLDEQVAHLLARRRAPPRARRQ